jgi:hypothetical protein
VNVGTLTLPRLVRFNTTFVMKRKEIGMTCKAVLKQKAGKSM